MSLLSFQQAAVSEILEDLREGAQAIRLAAPTGAGKTRMLAAIAAAATRPDVVWLWTAPLGVLLDQARGPLMEAGLRVRDLDADRARPHQVGDIWLATLQLLANRDALLHADSEQGPSLLRWREALRQDGLRLGVILDEAHVGLEIGARTTAFADRLRALAPDLLLAASATPNDVRLRTVVQALGLPTAVHTVPRSDAVAAHLVKPRLVLSYLEPASDPFQNETLRRQGLLRHAGRMLDQQAQVARAHGIPLRPLLLLQVSNDAGSKAEVDGEVLLRETFGWSHPDAVVRADGDSRALQDALGRPGLRALVFKEAGALGFDAPEASALVSFRPVLDASRAQQAIGRVLRIPAALRQVLSTQSVPLPADDLEVLTSAWVCVPDQLSQGGYSEAAKALNALEQAYDIDVQTQALAPVPPPSAPAPPSAQGDLAASGPASGSSQPSIMLTPGPLFGGALPAGPFLPVLAPLLPSTLRPSYATQGDLDLHAAALGLRIHRRRLAMADIPTDPPAFLPSERRAEIPLLDTLDDGQIWSQIVPTPEEIAALLPQARGLVQVKIIEDSLRLDQPNRPPIRLSSFFQIENLIELDLIADAYLRTHFNDFGHGLQDRLRERMKALPYVSSLALSPQGIHVLFVGLMIQRKDRLSALLADLRDTRAKEMSVHLPDLLVSPVEADLRIRRRSLYETDMPAPDALARWRSPALPPAIVIGGLRHTVVPMDETFAINRAERWLVDLLEDSSFAGVVRWWHRNPPSKPWSVGLRRSDSGGLHYPDFVVGLADGTRRLVETKEDTDLIARLRRRAPLKAYGPEILLHAGRDGLRRTSSDGQPIGPALMPDALAALLLSGT